MGRHPHRKLKRANLWHLGGESEQGTRPKVMTELLEAIGECFASCDKCHEHCVAWLIDEDSTLSQGQRDLLIDCASTCATNRKHSKSELPCSREMCVLCAQVCRACAVGCESVSAMSELARECRRCAHLCEIVAEAMRRLV